MRAATARIVAALLVAVALQAVSALAPAPVAAARPNLTIVGAATYDVRPDEGRVAVTVELTATNHLRDTPTRRYFFRTAVLTVLPGTSGFKLTGGGGTPKVSVRARTEAYTNIRLDFGANLAAGKTMKLTLTFDLKDPGGAADRPVRISPSLITFSAWAYATPETPGATVAVKLPTGYTTTVGRGPLAGPVVDKAGADVWTSGPLDAPLEFVADIAADRSADYVETAREVPLSDGPATILLRAWPDDLAWRDRMIELVEGALPILERDIGTPWPVDGPLAVHEALVRGTGGYAGLFDPGQRKIEIAYAAPDVVVLHELAHAWFNGALVADRWAAEAFASYYAERAASDLGLDATPPDPGDDPGTGRIPLNEWGPSGSQSPETETYGYSASLQLAEAIAERAGDDGLRAVWAAVAADRAPYQPDGVTPPSDGPELSGGPPDWRGLLDLVEDEAGEPFDDLWLTWVARPDDVPLLDARAAAREVYASTVEQAGAWRLPLPVRVAMRAWRFDAATELLTTADGVLDQRDRLVASAAGAGLTLPDTLRQVFEGAGGLEAAAAEANAEQLTVDAITAAERARPAPAGVGQQLLVNIGLVGTDPAGQVATARAGLTAGELEPAYRSALAAEATWLGAADSGRGRLISLALLAAALIVFATLLRARRRPAKAVRALAAEPAAEAVLETGVEPARPAVETAGPAAAPAPRTDQP